MARESLMRTARHPGCPLLQWRLKLTARDQPQHMRSIVEQRNIFRFAEGGYLRDRLREKEQAFAHHDQLRRDLVDEFNRFLGINMIVIGGER